MFFFSCLDSPRQEQKEERADVWADRGGSETEEGSVESSVQALLRPKDCPPAGKPPACGLLPPHLPLPVLTSRPPGGREEEDTDVGAAGGFPDAAEGGVEGRVQEVLRSKDGSAPGGAVAVRTPAAEHGAVRRKCESQQRRAALGRRRDHVQLRGSRAAAAEHPHIQSLFLLNYVKH